MRDTTFIVEFVTMGNGKAICKVSALLAEDVVTTAATPFATHVDTTHVVTGASIMGGGPRMLAMDAGLFMASVVDDS